MDLRVDNGEPSSPALTCPRATISFRGFTQLFLQPCITACWWLNPSCQRLRQCQNLHVIVGARLHGHKLTP
jgi:hypothetical protein